MRKSVIIILLIIIILLTSIAVLGTSIYINFSTQIEEFLIKTLSGYGFDTSLLVGTILQSYKISNVELVILGSSNQLDDRKTKNGINNKLSLPRGITVQVSGNNYPFHYKSSEIFKKETENIFLSNVFENLKMTYIVRYAIMNGNEFSYFSRSTLFRPSIGSGGSTYSGESTIVPVFKSMDNNDKYYGQACIIKRNDNFGSSANINIVLGVQFFKNEPDLAKFTDDDLTINSIYTLNILNVFETTPTKITFSNNQTGFTLNNPSTTFISGDFFTQMLPIYNVYNNFDDDDSNDNFIKPFTIDNSFLIIPDEANFKAAITHFCIKNSYFSEDGKQERIELYDNGKRLI